MIAAGGLRSLVFPWLLMDSAGRVKDSGAGSLFSNTSVALDFAASQAADMRENGWSTCKDGYALYKFSAGSIRPDTVVLYGLKVVGVSTAQGRSDGLSIRLQRNDVERYVSEFCLAFEAVSDHYQALIRQNIHEIRGINSALYNSAYELQSSLDIGNFSEASQWQSTSKSVVSLSEILRGRIDFMEFISDPSAGSVSRTDIAVYRKFDRGQRSFRVTAQKRDITLILGGASVGHVYGPPIFDLVPYLLIENAIKYSPDGSSVKIHCSESDTRIICSVTSLGPYVHEDEQRLIFQQGYRGRNARKTGATGSGLGLNVLKRIVEDVFAGSISMEQTDIKRMIRSVPYCEIKFETVFPAKTEFLKFAKLRGHSVSLE